MKKFLLLAYLGAAVMFTSCTSSSDEEIIGTGSGMTELTGDITASQTLTSDKIYLLKGNVFVTNNAVLTIQPGTIIKGDKTTKGALVITRGAKIMAEGTADKPIVFTSSSAAGSRSQGDWGGLVLLGKAANNQGTSAQIEGISDATDKAKHGGTENADNSGVLKYIRVEYAGIALTPDNEINGITFGSVGSGTVVDYVEVYRSGDDAYEWFGGTVNAKHLLAIDSWDDDFDTDWGFSGNVQYGLAQRLANTADVSGSNGFESDNNGSGTSATPQTSAIFANMTILGPRETNSPPSINANYQHAAQIRRNSAISIVNSVFAGYTEGIFYDDALPATGPNSSAALLADNSLFLNNLVYGCNSKSNQIKATGATLAAVTAKITPTNTFAPDSYAAALYTDPYKFSSDLAPSARVGTPNFVQVAGSAGLTGAAWAGKLNTITQLDKVAFRGAFGTDNWAAGWAHFDPQSLPYTTPGAVK